MNKMAVVFLTLCIVACVTTENPYGATREAAALRKGGALPVPRSFPAVRAAFDPSGKHHVMQKWMTVDYEDVIDGKCDNRICFFYFKGDREARKPAYCSIKFDNDTCLPDDEHPLVSVKKGTTIRLEEDWK